jgi:hypothetical protein
MTIDHFNVSGRACVIVTRRVSKPSNQPALDKRSSKFAFRQIPERRPSMQPSGKSVAGAMASIPSLLGNMDGLPSIPNIRAKLLWGNQRRKWTKWFQAMSSVWNLWPLRGMKLLFLRCAGLQAQADRMTSVRIIWLYKKHNNIEMFRKLAISTGRLRLL